MTRQWLYHKLSLLRDRDLPEFLVTFIDRIRYEFLWEAEQ